MARPKGSKNKPKDALRELINRPRVETPEKPEVVVPKVTEEVAKEWKPEPEFKKVPKEKVPCGTCAHPSELHFGGQKDWCNQRGCNCQAWNGSK